MLEHGGQIRAAAARYGIPPDAWLDLSTGINPVPYEPPAVSADAWWRLPQEGDGLEHAAADYYGTPDILPVAGSQAAIQALPRMRGRCRVGILHPGYAEHAHAWRAAGHDVARLSVEAISGALDALDVLVVTNPNNPTGAAFSRDALLAWHDRLAKRGGWLVADEAFIEGTSLDSLAQARMPQGLIVLRSLGKFFGLAGARVGFVLAPVAVCEALRELLGPWALCGPSRMAARAALRDRAWQARTRERLVQDGTRLKQILNDAGIAPRGGCTLFQWVATEEAERLHDGLARQGILIRLFADPGSVRFGLPGGEADWARLRKALAQR